MAPTRRMTLGIKWTQVDILALLLTERCWVSNFTPQSLSVFIGEMGITGGIALFGENANTRKRLRAKLRSWKTSKRW